MSVSNVVYNVNVKSKFDLFLNDDLCEAEPEELVKRISNDRKKKELAHKETKKQKHNEVKVAASKSAAEKISMSVDGKVHNERGSKPPKTEVKAYLKPKYVFPINKGVVNDEASEDKTHTIKTKSPFDNGVKKVRGREFDRRSGSDKTGVKSVDRREGSGAYNWGNVKDLVDLSQELTTTELKEDALDEILEVFETASERKDMEKMEMTFREWKALNVSNTVVASRAPTRPANNGENVFTGMNVYIKKNVHHSESDSEMVILDDDIDTKGRKQINVNIEFSGRGRRGVRSGFNPRFPKDKAADVVKDDIINLDEDEFPTLS